MTPYKAAESNKCVENCGNNYLFKRHNSCYLDCQSIKTTRTVFIQEETKECVFECSKGFGRYYESSINCYNCSINNKVAKDGFCIDCGGDQNCMNLGNYIFEDNTASNCDNYDCQNNGNCFIKNNEAYCNCTENYYGLKCELGLENAINITNDLIDDFLTPKSSFKDEEKYKSYEDKNGDIYYLLDDEDIIKQIREISILIKNPKIVEDIYKSSDKINQLMNVCINMINKMIDGIIELNANILEFFDLATNLVSSKIQISSLRRLRNLQDENNGEININLEEEKKRINDLIEKASKLYYQINLDDIKSGIYNLNMATTDYNKYRSLYYQRWTIKSYYQIKDQIIKNDELMYVDYTSCVSN